MKAKAKAYTIMAEIKASCDLTINAETLEEALKQARGLNAGDFVDYKGELMDDEIHINGLFEG